MNNSTQGYEVDSGGEVTRVTSLSAALKWFQKSFEEDHYDDVRFRKFDVVDQVKGDFVMDYTTSHSRHVNQDKNEITDLNVEWEKSMVKKNPNMTKRYDIRRFTVCWVVGVKYISPLSTIEKRYYYVVYRNKWYNKWANNLYPFAKKWFNKDGITLKADILMHSMRNPDADHMDVSGASTLVLVTENLEIFYASMDKINKLAAKNLGIVTDKWNQQVVGIPRDEFSVEDVNNYE